MSKKEEKRIIETELTEVLHTNVSNTSENPLQNQESVEYRQQHLEFSKSQQDAIQSKIENQIKEKEYYEPQSFYRQTLMEQIIEYERRLNNNNNDERENKEDKDKQENKSAEQQKIEEQNVKKEEEFKRNITNYMESNFAMKAKPSFLKDFNAALNGGYAQDLKLAVMLENLRHSKKLQQIFKCCGSIFVPMLITGMENFKSYLPIDGCKNENGKELKLSQCVWCNRNESSFNVGQGYTFFVYILWFIFCFVCVYIFIVNLRYARLMNALNPYGFKVVGTFLESIKAHKFQFMTVFGSILIGTISTRILRDIVLSFTKQIDCPVYTNDDDEEIRRQFVLSMSANSLSIGQYIIAIIVSFIFYTEAFILIFSKSASPISLLVSSSELFNREYNENFEYMTYRLRGITKQINIKNFYQECNQVIEDSGYSKFQVVFLKSMVIDAIVLVLVYRIEYQRLYVDIDKFDAQE